MKVKQRVRCGICGRDSCVQNDQVENLFPFGYRRFCRLNYIMAESNATIIDRESESLILSCVPVVLKSLQNQVPRTDRKKLVQSVALKLRSVADLLVRETQRQRASPDVLSYQGFTGWFHGWYQGANAQGGLTNILAPETLENNWLLGNDTIPDFRENNLKWIQSHGQEHTESDWRSLLGTGPSIQELCRLAEQVKTIPNETPTKDNSQAEHITSIKQSAPESLERIIEEVVRTSEKDDSPFSRQKKLQLTQAASKYFESSTHTYKWSKGSIHATEVEILEDNESIASGVDENEIPFSAQVTSDGPRTPESDSSIEESDGNSDEELVEWDQGRPSSSLNVPRVQDDPSPGLDYAMDMEEFRRGVKEGDNGQVSEGSPDAPSLHSACSDASDNQTEVKETVEFASREDSADTSPPQLSDDGKGGSPKHKSALDGLCHWFRVAIFVNIIDYSKTLCDSRYSSRHQSGVFREVFEALGYYVYVIDIAAECTRDKIKHIVNEIAKRFQNGGSSEQHCFFVLVQGHGCYGYFTDSNGDFVPIAEVMEVAEGVLPLIPRIYVLASCQTQLLSLEESASGCPGKVLRPNGLLVLSASPNEADSEVKPKPGIGSEPMPPMATSGCVYTRVLLQALKTLSLRLQLQNPDIPRVRIEMKLVDLLDNVGKAVRNEVKTRRSNQKGNSQFNQQTPRELNCLTDKKMNVPVGPPIMTRR